MDSINVAPAFAFDAATPVPLDGERGATHVIAEYEGFVALRVSWNLLVSEQPHQTPFLRHEWFDAAWQWCKQGAALRILCFYVDRRLAAVLPLMIRTLWRRHVPVRELSFVSIPDTQHCDIIASPPHATDACRHFAVTLRTQVTNWDVLRLTRILPESTVASLLVPALRSVGVRAAHGEVTLNHYVPLDVSWDHFLKRRGSKFRSEARNRENQIRRAGSISVERVTPDDFSRERLGAIWKQVATVSARSWKSATENAFNSVGPYAFGVRLASEAFCQRMLSISILTLNGHPIAAEYALVLNDDVYSLRLDFDEAYRCVSPGAFLQLLILQDLIGRGLRRYYMGHGDNTHKIRLTDGADVHEDRVLCNRTARGMLVLAHASVRGTT